MLLVLFCSFLVWCGVGERERRSEGALGLLATGLCSCLIVEQVVSGLGAINKS